MNDSSIKLVDTGHKGAHLQAIHDGVYTISPRGLVGQSLSVRNKSLYPYLSLICSQFENEAHQQFIIKYDKEDECYTIQPLNSLLFLGIEKIQDSNHDGALIIQNSRSDDHLFKWQISIDEYATIQLKGTDYNIEYKKDLNDFRLAKKNNSDAQKFKILTTQIIKNGLYYITSKSPRNIYFSFSKANQTKNSYLSAKNQSDHQIFYVIFDNRDGCYSILNLNTLQCLSPGRNPTQKSQIYQSDFYNLDHQKWVIGTYDKKFGNYFLLLKSDSLFICNPIVNDLSQIYLGLRHFDSSKPSMNDSFQFQPFSTPFYISFISKSNEEKKLNEYKDFIQKVVDHRYWTKIVLEKNKTMKGDVKEMRLKREFLENCFLLQELHIPHFYIDVDDDAFIHCPSIKAIKSHPKWLTLLPNPMNVENIVVPHGVELIGLNYFDNFNNLKYLSLPNSLKFENCDKNAFKNIYGLKIFEGDPIFLKIIHKGELVKLCIPFYVKEIPNEACANCKKLAEVHIEKDSQLMTIESRAFANCECLRSFYVPESVTNVSPDAFINCNKDFKQPEMTNEKQIKSYKDNLVIDPEVANIEEEYKLCVNITSLEIPLEVKYESNMNIFKRFEKLKYVKCDPKWLNNFITENIEIVFIPDTIEEIKKSDFDNLIHLKFVEIPESVEEIEKNAFQNCNELTSVKCGTKHFKFLNQKQIKTINLNEQVDHIALSDFEGFINLESCMIPNTIKRISPNVFINCKKLMNIDHPKGKSLINNSVTIDDDRTEILKEEFKGWTNLKTLEIPSSIEKIEEDAFNDCVNLKYLTCDPKWFPFIPKNSIRKVVIPDYVKEIKKGQFDEFYSMVYIKLPKAIRINDPSIFDQCESLKIIRCKSSVFANLSDKTIERCDKKIRKKYENPIFNFQPNPSLVHYESDLDRKENIDDTLDVTFSTTIYSTLTSTQRMQATTTIDDLVTLDPKVNEYRRYITNVLWSIQSGETKRMKKPKNTSISEISNVCGVICHDIYKALKIIPRIGQIYAILYLADEILNKEQKRDENEKLNGMIAEVKEGEGKTLIITILAVLFVKYGHNVDIVKSSLQLAKRDRISQRRIFDLFHIQTSVFYDKRTDVDLLTRSTSFKKPEYFNEYKEYDQSEFSNFNLQEFDCPVVYSTNRNYEYYYLHTLFSMIPRKRPFDIVLIDEVDNMLIDDLESPAAISKEINYAFAQNIFCIVYSTRFMKVPEILDLLKKEFPNIGEFTEEDVELLKNAALESDSKVKDIDYIVKDKKIVIIDHNTGFIMPSTYWPNYVQNMVEIKETIKPSPASISFCQVTQQTYFNLYSKIVGVTGTIGSESDEQILKEGYNVGIFKVPRNVPTKIEVFYKNRPESFNVLCDMVQEEILGEKIKGRPVLVIWDSKFNLMKFKKEINFKNVQMITGENLDEDEKAIENAGKERAITITTSEAIKGVDIQVRKEAIENGGLHVVIPMKIINLRSLEQAVGRTGRHGQPGSVTIFISNDDMYLKTPQFCRGNKNLMEAQFKFANYIRNNLSWLLCGPGKNTFDGQTIYPYASNYSDVMYILSSRIFFIFKNYTNLNKFQDLAWIMVQTSWGVFFTSLQNDSLNNGSSQFCEREYVRFIKELETYINPKESKSIVNAIQCLKHHFANVRNQDTIIYKGLKITAQEVVVISNKIKSENESNFQPTKKKEFLKIPETIKNIKATCDWIVQKFKENKKLIPSRRMLDKTPNIEIQNVDLNKIKLALKLAGESYKDGAFSIGKVLYSSDVNDQFKPKFYCVEDMNKLYVCTRGSVSFFDFLTDFTCHEVCVEINGSNYYFHKGFIEAANFILPQISEFLDRDYEETYFIGHSYGAAVSNVLCMLTKSNEKYKEKKIFSIAFAPPPSMSKIPAHIQECMYSFINKEDIIPHMSLLNILHTVDLKQIPLSTFFSNFCNFLRASKNKTIMKFVEFLDKYEKEIMKTLESVHGELHVHKNIGNIFYVGLSDTKELKNCQVDETDLPNTIFFTLSMITHHFMVSYEESFKIIETY